MRRYQNEKWPISKNIYFRISCADAKLYCLSVANFIRYCQIFFTVIVAYLLALAFVENRCEIQIEKRHMIQGTTDIKVSTRILYDQQRSQQKHMRITVTTAAAANSNNKQRCNSNKTNKNGIPFMLNNSDGKMRTQRNMKSKKPRSINNILFSYRSTSNRIGVYTNWEQFSFEIQISRQSLF